MANQKRLLLKFEGRKKQLLICSNYLYSLLLSLNNSELMINCIQHIFLLFYFR